MKLIALLIGATGLVGSEILALSLADERIEKIKVFSRRSTGIKNSKLEEFIVDFENMNDWKEEIKGDVLFSALGTTIKQVGSREAQRVVDYNYQLKFAQEAYANGVKNIALISATGADPDSSFAYNKMKGDLERDILKLNFTKITILRPGLLHGPRPQKRLLEEVSGKLLGFLPEIYGLEGLKPVSGKTVAQVCFERALNESNGVKILSAKEILGFLK
jgi:uncharacterized protein YbjT (DUF2867 family)